MKVQFGIKPRKAGSANASADHISTMDLVKHRPMFEQGTNLLLIEPCTPGVDLAHWAKTQKAFLHEQLSLYGAVLFRGFQVKEHETFQNIVEAATDKLLPYSERSSPRVAVKGDIYTSTTHPQDEEIFLHTEQSYNLNFPNFISFCCMQAPKTQGATPVADVRRVLARLPKEVVSRFREVGYQYVRNFRSGLGLPWQEAFQTDDPAVAEAYCKENHIDFRWCEDGGLQTSQVRPTIATHPSKGCETWFNHLTFFHITSLKNETVAMLRKNFSEKDVPNNTFYGDGTPIPDDIVAQIREAYRAESVRFDWQNGDIMILDNMLMAHGREPFTGDRLITVVMTGLTKWSAVSSSAGLPEALENT